MLLHLWGVATLGATWIIAYFIGTQAAMAGAVVMTFALLGVAIIYWILERPQL
jgi:hypothetical protein